jgi:glycosyltransferase involved in cell wall biosynthesis
MKVLTATAIYPTAENPAWGSFVRTQVECLKRAGVTVELLLIQGRPQKLMYAKAALEIRRRLANDSIDLVHAHYSYAGMIACTQWKVPVVVSYCGDDILGTIGAKGKPTVLSKVVVMAGCMLSRHADAVIVKSREMANKLKRQNVYIIPHEIDFEVFHPVKKSYARGVLRLDPGKKYLLFAANPQIPVKRFPLAKAVAEELKKRDPSVELLVVCKESQDRLNFFMNACDALVFTSYQEGSPNVVKQAMACNLPIVATDVGDVAEVIGGTEGCYVCKPDVSEFAKCISDILRHPQRTRGHEQVQHLAGPVVAKRVIDVYEQVLKKREGYAVNRVQTDPFTGR